MLATTELWLTESTKGHFERSSHNQPHSLVKRMHKQEFTFPHKNISLSQWEHCRLFWAQLLLQHQHVSSHQLSILLAAVKTPADQTIPYSLLSATEKADNVHTVHAMRNQMSTNVIVPRLLPVLSCRQIPISQVGKFPKILSLKAKKVLHSGHLPPIKPA